MSSRFKPLEDVLEITWKIATLHYVYEYFFSKTIQFVLFSPIFLPLSLVLAVLVIYLALGVVFVVTGLLALGVFSVSDKVPTILIIVFALIIIYNIIFAVISFVKSKLKIVVYRECKKTAMEKFHRVKDMFSCKRTHPSNCYTYKCGRSYEKMQKAAKGHKFDAYRPVRAAIGYILDIFILMYENVHNLHCKIGRKLLQLCGLRDPPFVIVCDQTDQTIPRDGYINMVGDDKTCYLPERSTEIDLPIQTSYELVENVHKRNERCGTTKRHFPSPIATQEDVEEIWKEIKKIQEMYEARLHDFYQNE